MGFPQTLPSFGDELMTGSPIALFDNSDNNVMHRQAIIYYDLLSGGTEVLTLKVEIKRLEDNAWIQIDFITVDGSMANKAKLIEFISIKGLKVTATQTGGTMRHIKWEAHKI